MSRVTHAQLDWNSSGTPVSEHFDDVYFSNVDGLEETRYVFIGQNKLIERWHQWQERRFVVAETGFGTGLNFLATWQLFEKFLQDNPQSPLKELHFISFEKFPLALEDLKKAHQSWEELKPYAEQLQINYPLPTPDCHRFKLGSNSITLDLWYGDIHHTLPQVPNWDKGIVDAWFLDGFAPSKNPDMWTQDLFDGLARLAKENSTIATFTAAGFVRRGLIESGFEMQKVKGFGTKRDMLAGHFPLNSSTLEATNQTGFKPWFKRQSPTQSESIAIIGGGIASATLAQQLVSRAKKVTLYCKDKQPAQGASGNRQGAVYPLLTADHSILGRFFSNAFTYARRFVDQQAQQFHFDHEWSGVIQLMWNEKAEKKLSAVAASDLPSDLVRKLSAKETSKVMGLPSSFESLYYPLAGWLCPAELTAGIFNSLIKHSGFTAHYDCEVTELKWLSEKKQWQVTNNSGDSQHFDTVVIANGHEFSKLSQTRQIPLGAVKGQVSHIPTSDSLKKLNTVLCYDGYLTPNNPNNNHHCIGASYDRNNIDTLFDAGAQQDNVDKLRTCIPDQDWPKEADGSSGESRQGIRCVSRDHLPFVGNVGDTEAIASEYQNLQSVKADQAAQLPVQPNLFCFLGLGSRGLSSAPLLAEVLASQICGEPLPLPLDILEALEPSRMWTRKLRKGKQVSW